MAIYQPSLLLTEADKEALVLLGQLILAEQGDAHNVCRDSVTLSPAEAERLLSLLESFSTSQLFVEGSYFAEGMANGDAWTDDGLREIYLSQRRRQGRTRVMSSRVWSEFVLRAGFDSSSEAWMWPSNLRRSPLRPMTLDHFLRMEVRLALAAGLHPRVRALIIKFVEDSIPTLADIRERKAEVQRGSLRAFVGGFIENLSDHVGGREKKPMSRRQVIAVSTIVMDVAAMFSTRDWTAAGVLSSLAGLAPDALDYPPDR
jgi:hypothetical protein